MRGLLLYVLQSSFCCVYFIYYSLVQAMWFLLYLLQSGYIIQCIDVIFLTVWFMQCVLNVHSLQPDVLVCYIHKCLVRVVFVILVYVVCYIYNSSVYGVFAIFFIVWFLWFCYILQCSLYFVCYTYYSLVSVVFAISITVWFMLCMLYFL